jgi:RHS repeat-associated protein
MLEYIDTAENNQDLDFTYDGLGRRIMVRRGNATVVSGQVTGFSAVETRKYVYLGGSVIRELNGSDQAVKGYVRGLDLGGGIGGILYQKKSSDYYYYHYNHKGDVVALTDGDGDLAAFYEYDAWGNTMTEAQVSGVDNLYRYSTKEWDEKSALYYFGFRYYSPEVGRWTQRDPVGIEDGVNLYPYVADEPVSRIDAWGLQGEMGWPLTNEDYEFVDRFVRSVRSTQKPFCWTRFEMCWGNCMRKWVPTAVVVGEIPVLIDRAATIIRAMKKMPWPGGERWQLWWHKYALTHDFSPEGIQRMRRMGRLTLRALYAYAAYNALAMAYCTDACLTDPDAY